MLVVVVFRFEEEEGEESEGGNHVGNEIRGLLLVL